MLAEGPGLPFAESGHGGCLRPTLVGGLAGGRQGLGSGAGALVGDLEGSLVGLP